MSEQREGLYILLISVHGLVRGENLELGRDADTGGQIKYVLELARALIENPEVARVDLLTRRVIDAKVDDDYAEPEEEIVPGAHIIRLSCGPRRYLRKEVLWPYLDSFADQALKHIRRVGRVPDVVHAHYADGGYVGVKLSGLLEVPLVYTGHSLGRVKRERLIANGAKPENIESQYNMSQRIEAEELSLDTAALVVTSTHQEVEEQYALYDNYQPESMEVIPPGVDLQRFYPPKPGRWKPDAYYNIGRFLQHPNRPMVLALSRADPRKNIATLVRAYAENERLREIANLVIIAGNRDDLSALEKGPRRVLTELMLMIDHYDLYGRIAYPKHHEPEDVPNFYRIAARTRGVFVNPALTEPFGLTLLEAAASGLPMVATNDGGPQDIVNNCKNGVLVDPLDADGMGNAILEIIENRTQWRRYSRGGINGTQRHYTWEGHVQTYIGEVKKVLQSMKRRKGHLSSLKSRLPTSDRILICSLDNALVGNDEALDELRNCLRHAKNHIGFGIATGRSLDSARKLIRKHNIPAPDFLLTSVGSEIFYGPNMIRDESWNNHIDYRWDRDKVIDLLADFPGLKLQAASKQHDYKVSYFIDMKKAPPIRDLKRHLRSHDLHVNPVLSYQYFLDVLPLRASKGAALRYVAEKWGIPIENILVAGDSGNDEDMLSGDTLGLVIGNHSEELEKLRGREQIFFADGEYAWGVLEGMHHYNFLGTMHEEEAEQGETRWMKESVNI